jgi:hypothetical protein
MDYRVILHIALIFLLPVWTYAQIRSIEKVPPDYLGIGAEAGITIFYGDLDDGPAKGNYLNNYAFKFYVNRTLGPMFSALGSITFGKISGEKKRGSGSNFYNYFNAQFIEYTFNAGIDFVPLIVPRIKNKLKVEGLLGLGLIDFKTKRYDGVSDTLVQSFGYDGQKSTTEMVIPFGAKVLYHINKKSAISIQTVISRVDTDKLDALEGNNNTDYYNFTSFGYIYKFYPGRKNNNQLNSIRKRR